MKDNKVINEEKLADVTGGSPVTDEEAEAIRKMNEQVNDKFKEWNSSFEKQK